MATLTDFLQRRLENSQAQREKERERLTKDDYQRAREELNNTSLSLESTSSLAQRFAIRRKNTKTSLRRNTRKNSFIIVTT
jgi:hypothetical protein